MLYRAEPNRNPCGIPRSLFSIVTVGSPTVSKMLGYIMYPVILSGLRSRRSSIILISLSLGTVYYFKGKVKVDISCEHALLALYAVWPILGHLVSLPPVTLPLSPVDVRSRNIFWNQHLSYHIIWLMHRDNYMIKFQLSLARMHYTPSWPCFMWLSNLVLQPCRQP